MKELIVPRLSGDAGALQASGIPALLDGREIPFQPIACLNWPEWPYHPQAEVRMAHTGSHILLHYRVHEATVRSVAGRDNGPVWEDSCVEFFLSPDPSDGIYYNFECNCTGRLLVGGGPVGTDRPHAPLPLLREVGRWASLGTQDFAERLAPYCWQVALLIPCSALFQHAVTSLDGLTMRANFYKCGDLTLMPHFLSWSPIDTPSPSFHQPGFFGRLHFASL